ncbi:MAG: hypothetical protein EP341_07015 [Sphingomonadales bacterium]|nr:MAG: hypothetical protein EP341_07015 [Sphingomonadales bacterium]
MPAMLSPQLIDAIALPAAGIGLALGVLLVLFAERYVACLRRWMHIQQRMIRRPGYLRMHRVIGWALSVTSLLLLALLALSR